MTNVFIGACVVGLLCLVAYVRELKCDLREGDKLYWELNDMLNKCRERHWESHRQMTAAGHEFARSAFRAGFIAHQDTRNGGWAFDEAGSIAHDLESGAWAAWERLK